MTTHAKEDFWIGAKGGLVECKHYKRMGNAVWLFLHLLRCQTALSPNGEGVVYYGRAIRLESIRQETRGIPVRTLKQWAIRLREQGYIRTEDHGCKGLVFWIANAKHKTKKAQIQRVAAPTPRKPQVGFGRISVPIDGGMVQKTVPIAARMVPNQVPIETPERPYANQPETLAAESKTPIPKGFTPTHLSNPNTATAAQSAASFTSLLRDRNFKTISQPPRPKPTAKPKPLDAELVAWQDRQAARDPAIAEYRKAHGL